MSLIPSESYEKPDLKEGLTWELTLYKESPVLAMLYVHGVRAKLSILKSGQDRLEPQASVSQ